MRPNLSLTGEHGDHTTKPKDASTKFKAPTLTIFDGKVAEPIDHNTPLATSNVEGVSQMSNYHGQGIEMTTKRDYHGKTWRSKMTGHREWGLGTIDWGTLTW